MDAQCMTCMFSHILRNCLLIGNLFKLSSANIDTNLGSTACLFIFSLLPSFLLFQLELTVSPKRLWLDNVSL